MTTSVIIPAHNSERWIAKAIRSCQEQTVRPDEVIVASDGSTDGTVTLARSLGAKVLDLPKGNANVARNAGVRASSGELLLFLDADDWYEPDKIERHVSVQEGGSWGLVIDPATMVDEAGRVLRLAGPPINAPLDYRGFLKRRFWYGGSSFSTLRRNLAEIDGWREELRSQQDIDLWLRLAHEIAPAFVMGSSHTWYLQTSGSTSRRPNLVLANLDVLVKGLPFLSGFEKRTLRSHVIFTAADNLPLGQALPLLSKAWDRCYDPRFLKAIARSFAKQRAKTENNLLIPS